MEFLDDLKESNTLISRTIIFRSSRFRYTANIADPNRRMVFALRMSTRTGKGTALFNSTIATDNHMVPDIRPPSFFGVPFPNFIYSNI